MNASLTHAHRHFLSLMPRCYWLLRNVIDARLEPMGLSSAQWRPLLLLHGAEEPMTQVQIARALGLESPTVVRLLDRLVEKGWVTRRNCPGDRRAYHVELTDPARALCAEIERILQDLRSRVLSDVSLQELEQASGVLARVHAQLTVLDQASATEPPAGSVAVKPGAARVRAAAKPGRAAASHKMRAARPDRASGPKK